MRIGVMVILTAFSAIASSSAQPPLSGKPISFEQTGAHIPLVIVEKSVKRENILVVFTKVDANCHIEIDKKRNEPTVGFYWLLNGTKVKLPSSIAEWAVRGTYDIEAHDSSSFFMRPKAKYLSRIKHDLADQRFLVKAEKTTDGCMAGAFINLGSMDRSREIRIDTAYGDISRKSILDFKGKVNYVLARGVDARTAERYERRFEGND